MPALAAAAAGAPGTRGSSEFFVTRERHATFRQAPGSGALRPAAGTGVPGLFLAGAWTDTGWPDTMEGAVRSGPTAAASVPVATCREGTRAGDASIPHAVTLAGRELVEPATAGRRRPARPADRAAVAAYHFGWVDADGPAPTRPAGGKALRPALALLSARAAGADTARGRLPAAVAVELVHNFSLLHDDIMDGDRMRRHRPAAWTVFGVPAAILAGDALLALAVEVLLDRRHRRRAPRRPAAWPRPPGELIAGQAARPGLRDRAPTSALEECLAMATDKTGALMACACAIGAVLAGRPNRLARRCAAFGEDLGLAFQLVDDLLGIWGEPGA